MEKIERLPLREQIYRRLVEGLVTGEFAPGEKIKDADVAGQLGISRTPVREALIRLDKEGFLDSQVGRGFVVRPLVRRELEEIYPILIQLECLALRGAPLPSPKLLAELRQLGDEIGADNQDPLRRLELDLQWHTRLIDRCGNARLLGLISQFKVLIQRYLNAYILVRPRIQASIDDHAQILDVLASGDVDGAVDRLTTHWNRNLSALLDIFKD